jgi:hypothetical protein
LNEEPEVGNVGVFTGSWGERSSIGADIKQARRDAHDRQIMKCPGQVMVLCEATAAVESLLQRPAVAGDEGGVGLAGRNTFEWLVHRGSEKSSILIAARKDTSSAVTVEDWFLNDDHVYREKKK